MTMPVQCGALLKGIEGGLSRFLPQCRSGHLRGLNHRHLNDALRYALFPGGKRLRPLLTLLGARVFGMDDDRVLMAACAVEFVHASSLIIDDLPCMDDADLRRGRPALYLVYGEDVALLAAFALLNEAYSLFGQTSELTREATECIGVNGMIGGQETDLDPDAADTSLSERNRKTSALMRLAVTAGALACGFSRGEVAPLAEAGQCLGEAYQIHDDLQDAELSTGKTAGQDLRHDRPSHAVKSDRASCHAQVNSLTERARRSLADGYGDERAADLMSFIEGVLPSGVEMAPGNLPFIAIETSCAGKRG